MNKQAEVRVLIEKDVDVILPDQILSTTNGNKALVYIENDDGIEKLIAGWKVVVYVNDEYVDKCTMCKNGINGWVEFLNENLERERLEGDVKVYLVVPFDKGQKAPKVTIKETDIVLDEKDIRKA